jgi:hypothetical protein
MHYFPTAWAITHLLISIFLLVWVDGGSGIVEFCVWLVFTYGGLGLDLPGGDK